MEMESSQDSLSTLTKKMWELEELIKFILKWIKIDLCELPVVPEFLKDGSFTQTSFSKNDVPAPKADSAGPARKSVQPKSVKVTLQDNFTNNTDDSHGFQSNVSSADIIEEEECDGDDSHNAEMVIKVKEELTGTLLGLEEEIAEGDAGDLTHNDENDDTSWDVQENWSDFEGGIEGSDDENARENKLIKRGPIVSKANKIKCNPYVALNKLSRRELSVLKRTTISINNQARKSTKTEHKNSMDNILKTGTVQFKCRVCNDSFPTFNELSRHKYQKLHYVMKSTSIENSKWTCGMCGEKFPTNRALRHHGKKERLSLKLQESANDASDSSQKTKDKNHSNSNCTQGTSQFKCRVCDASYPTRQELRSHQWQESHHAVRPSSIESPKWPCAICGGKFPTYRALLHHKRNERHGLKLVKRANDGNNSSAKSDSPEKNVLKCKTCSETFPSRLKLVEHQKEEGHSNRKRTQFKCRVCEASFPSLVELRKHKWAEAHYVPTTVSLETSKWKCPVCDKNFPTIRALIHHKKVENHRLAKKRTKKCPTDDTSASIKVLALRKKYARVYKCSVCQIIFPTRSKRKAHEILEQHFPLRRSVKKIKECRRKKVPCLYCDYATWPGVLYDNHVRKHTKERPFLCGICGVAVRTLNTLKNHEKTLHGTEKDEKPYQCKYCGSRFKCKTTLQIHEDTHEGKKDKVCPECGMVCRNLKAHIREVHEKLRPFECHLCPLKFRRSCHLKRHLGSHNNPNGRRKGLHIERPGKISQKKKRTVIPRIEVNESVKAGVMKDERNEGTDETVTSQAPAEATESRDPGLESAMAMFCPPDAGNTEDETVDLDGMVHEI